eukprot:scaffold44485_cov52-Attheya_sp.AAC.1
MPTPTPVQHVYGQRKDWLPQPASSSGAMHSRHGEGGDRSSPTPGFGHTHRAIVKPVTQPFSTFGPKPPHSALHTMPASGSGASGAGEKESMGAASRMSHSSPSEGQTLLRSLFSGPVGGWTGGGNSAGTSSTSYLSSVWTGNDASETATGGTFAGSGTNSNNNNDHERSGSVTTASPS